MGRLILFTLLISFCLSLPAIPSSRPLADNILNVSYCDLIRNPGSYHKRVIRVHAKYRVGAKWSNLYDPNCGRLNETWINFDETYFDESFQPCEKLNVAEKIKFKGFDQDFDVVVVGKFFGTNETEYGQDGSRFMLVVGCVERAELIGTSGAEVLTANYCDLVRKPSSYDKRVVRVQGVYTSGFELSKLTGLECNEVEEGRTWVDFDTLYKTCTSKEVDASFNDLMREHDPANLMERRSASVVFLGYFEVSPTSKLVNGYTRNGFGHLGQYKNQFTVKCLEQAKPLPVN